MKVRIFQVNVEITVSKSYTRKVAAVVQAQDKKAAREIGLRQATLPHQCGRVLSCLVVR